MGKFRNFLAQKWGILVLATAVVVAPFSYVGAQAYYNQTQICSGTTPICATVHGIDGTGYAAGNGGLTTTAVLQAWNNSKNQSNPVGLDPEPNGVTGPLWTTTGGSTTASVPTGATNTVVKGSAGRIVSVTISVAGTGSGNVTCYDNATTNTGTPIATFPATIAVPATGAIPFNNFAANGITCANVLNGPVFTVSYY